MTELRVPYRSEDDDVTSIADAARETLTGEERRVTEQLAFDALARGTTKVGELLNELESADPAGRRRLLDRAREGCGMLSVEAETAHREFEQANANASLRPGRDAQGRMFQICAEPNCVTYPLGDQGEPIAVEDRRWWCGSHKHLAGPEDHLPPESRYEIDFATMSLRATDAEQQRLLAKDAELQAKAAERQRLRREDGERVEALVAARRAERATEVTLPLRPPAP